MNAIILVTNLIFRPQFAHDQTLKLQGNEYSLRIIPLILSSASLWITYHRFNLGIILGCVLVVLNVEIPTIVMYLVLKKHLKSTFLQFELLMWGIRIFFSFVMLVFILLPLSDQVRLVAQWITLLISLLLQYRYLIIYEKAPKVQSVILCIAFFILSVL